MSNVKVNGNTYADISSVRLPLSDGSGYAVYAEGQSQDENAVLTNMLTGAEIGDYTNDEITEVNLNAFGTLTCGTLSFPNATTYTPANMSSNPITCDNLLLPNLVGHAVGKTLALRGIKASGVLDLRKLTLNGTTGTTPLLTFFLYGATVGTLRIDSLNCHRENQTFQNSTIGTIVWGGADLVASEVATCVSNATSITDLYITDAIYDDVAALIADGTITKVANLHKYSEWSET